MKFELYKDRSKEWRWRLKSSNGRIIATGSEGYVNKADAENGIDLVKSTNTRTPVEE